MSIPFDNQFAQLPSAFYQRVDPSPVGAPKWIAFNRELADELGLDADALESEQGLGFFSGNSIPPGAEPLSMAYAGHQFGNFVPQLGDGRAILLGEVMDRSGQRRDIQLKGSGPTPFSRRGDGRSALGPVLREYLLSEAMHALGVPTTRALAAVTSGEQVWRETSEPGGVFTRVASSHLRIGTVEYFAARGDSDNLRKLVGYTLQRHYPAVDPASEQTPALALLQAVVEKQAYLVARWMSLGFIHGVMNTDNMTLSGETIDYGPCAFMDHYQPDKKYSYIDQNGRYAYSNQPNVAQWNLIRLAEALLPVITADADGSQEAAAEGAEAILGTFPDLFETAYREVFASKLGFVDATDPSNRLTTELLTLFHQNHIDFTLGFRSLSSALDDEKASDLLGLFESEQVGIREWLVDWRQGISDKAKAVQAMSAHNPAIIPRNHQIQAVIEAGNRGDFEPFDKLLTALQAPFADNSKYQAAPKAGEEIKHTFCGT